MSESFSNSDKEDSFKGIVKIDPQTPRACAIIVINSEESDENPSEGDDNSSDSSMHVLNSDADVDTRSSSIEVSDEEEAAGPPILKQCTMKSFTGNPVLQPKEEPQQQKVKRAEIQELIRRVDSIETELSRAKNALRIIKRENLPDNDKSLIKKERALNKMSQAARNVLANVVIDDNAVIPVKNTIKVECDQIKAEVDAVGPRTFGKTRFGKTSDEDEALPNENHIKEYSYEERPSTSGDTIVEVSDEEEGNSVLQPKEEPQQQKLVIKVEAPVHVKNTEKITWDQIEAGVDAVGPRTFGKKGVERFNTEKALAVETFNRLHKSLETCPTENDFVEDPKGLKIPLMPHQKRALAWLLWRENQKPSGGLLADDMGLGKTLTMISLVLKSIEINPDEEMDKENYRDKYSGGTLVVCPASLVDQWSDETQKTIRKRLLDVEVYHGTKRETKARKLAEHDLIITSYALIKNEFEKKGAIFGVRWRRIILDESHHVKNYKSKTAEAVFQLSSKSKWALTGTPVHNKELDMYALMKFWKCFPFDDVQVWKHWFNGKSTGGEMRLHLIISSLMLRRTKAELQEKGALKSLPNKTWEWVPVKLGKDEMDVYQKVLSFAQIMFAKFLHQRAKEDQDAHGWEHITANPQFLKMRNKFLKLSRVKKVSHHEILVLLLRLRQICCHPFLIRQMLQSEEDQKDVDEEPEEMNFLDQLNKIHLNNEDDNSAAGVVSDANVDLKEASKDFLNPLDPVFRAERPSSKIKALIKMLKEKVSLRDKAIIVSQWTDVLNLVATQLTSEHIIFDHLNGTISVDKRMSIVKNFNDKNSDTRVMLLSLTAGGEGLNLIAANHLFLLDLHWNPQLENQAQDRIYRMGQTKPIFVYKFMALGTIEERIKTLQDKKLEIAKSILVGSKCVGESKLGLQDLKMIFDFN